MSGQREWQLAGDLRQAFENYNGGAMVSGPWDKLIEELATAISDGQISLAWAARFDLLLQRTQGGVGPDHCEVCECPYPDQVHP
jgi:hypothetical protein